MRRVELIDFKDKDKAAIELSKKMTPEERIDLLFELIELACLFRPKEYQRAEPETLPFIIITKKPMQFKHELTGID